MDLYVRCTLEYLDTPSTKYFSGKFFVDSGEGSFTIVEYKPDGKKEEHKFFAHEFLSLGGPPSKSSAQQFPLVFDVSKQPSGRLYKRKWRLVFKTADHSQKVKDIYEELKKMFSKKPQTSSRMASTSTTSPVGMLRSRPDPVKSSRTEHRHRVARYIVEDSPPHRAPGLFSSGQSSKKPPSVTGLTSAAPRNVTSQTSILMENSLDSCNNISQEPANILVQEIVRPSSSNDNDIIEIVNNEPSRSSASKTSKQSSVVDVRNGMNEGNAKSGSSELQSTENGKETSSAKSGLPSSRSKESSKEQQNQKSRRPSNADKSSQGSIITLVEQKSIESSTIRVSAPFKARSHTVTFKQKRTDSSPTKPSL
ncbi:hypothetical protein Y032_0327g2617 [Ancylostoma ceylanicum]|uniref:Uncharacterized protein n=1 Tax=Ancylostoma ceylanicum TaxID=53326 RepID=A0A016S0Q0_9BILA|nr:hypothetical protein Y032_0327g2617 [Ancylostoma ceylanicum]